MNVVETVYVTVSAVDTSGKTARVSVPVRATVVSGKITGVTNPSMSEVSRAAGYECRSYTAPTMAEVQRAYG